MRDDDWALGQNEVDVRNEARNPLNAMPSRSRAEQDSLDLWQALDHLGILLETPAINPDAEQRRQESIVRALEEIDRLMRVDEVGAV